MGSVMQTLKLTQIGNSLGAVFPRAVLERLRLEKGDLLYVTETSDGLRLTTHDPKFAGQVAAARAIMRKRRAALHELAQ